MNCLSGNQKKSGLTYCRMVVFTLITLSILILSIYGNSFHCSWHFDDVPNITENSKLHMTEISWNSLKSAIFSDRNNPNMPYRPVSCLSFALNYFFGGLNVAGYHLVNILIHLATSIFLFLFVYGTLTLPILRKKYSSNAYPIALLATVLWAINPIQTQAITYIVQRMASLAAMFYIIGMYCYLRARISERSAKKVSFFVLCFISFCLALGSKENAAMFPMSVLLYEMLILQHDPAIFFRKNLLKFIAVLCLTLSIGLVYLQIKTGNPFSFLHGYENRAFTLGQRLLTEPRIILFYISLLFYPMPNRLNIAHNITISTSLFHPISTFFSILIIAGAIAGAIFLSKKRPIISFSVLFFFLNHVIESSIFPLELVFEHRNYLPSMFLFVPVAMFLHYLLDTYATKKAMRSIVSAFIILVIVGLGHSTFMRNFTWKNEKSLWIDAADKSPNLFRSHHNLAKYYQDHGQIQKAISEYHSALKKRTINNKNDKFITYYNLAKLYSDKKQYKKAVVLYKKSLHLNPSYPYAYNNLGVVMENTGRPNAAYENFLKALQLNPNSSTIHYNIGLFYLKRGKPDKAIWHLEKASKDNNYKKLCIDKLAIAYKQKGLLARAITYFKKSLKMRPNEIMDHLHLAEIFFRKGDQKSCQVEIDRFLRAIPNQEILKKEIKRFLITDDAKYMLPDPHIILSLLLAGCERRSSAMLRWQSYINETMLELKKKGGSKNFPTPSNK